MKDKIKLAFDEVKVTEKTKEKTKEAVFFEMRKQRGTKQKQHKFNLRYVLPAFACLIFMFVGVRFVYFVPTTEISIDINPSIELGVNRFDKIVSVKGFNEDGKKLANGLDLKHLDYQSAVDKVLESEKISELLENDYDMTIAVVGTKDKQSEKILKDMKSCTKSHTNTECYHADRNEVEEAHQIGLSYGKYKAYKQLINLGFDISPEELNSMTMKEIHDLIKCNGDYQEECNHSHRYQGNKKHQ